MSILGNPITLGGGGADLNIDFGSTPPQIQANCGFRWGRSRIRFPLYPILMAKQEIFNHLVLFRQSLAVAPVLCHQE